MFTFFGLFADAVDGVREAICSSWPDVDVISLHQPITAIAVRFGRDHYEPELEDIPKPIFRTVVRLSAERPAARFLLLRTECWGGACGNWGCVIRSGNVVFDAEGEAALRRLIAYWGVDLGPEEIFDPLRRDFPWRDFPGKGRDPKERRS